MTHDQYLERERQRHTHRERHTQREIHTQRDTHREREQRERERERDSCNFSHQYFIPSFLCKHPTILFQNKKGIFQHKNQTIN